MITKLRTLIWLTKVNRGEVDATIILPKGFGDIVEVRLILEVRQKFCIAEQ